MAQVETGPAVILSTGVGPMYGLIGAEVGVGKMGEANHFFRLGVGAIPVTERTAALWNVGYEFTQSHAQFLIVAGKMGVLEEPCTSCSTGARLSSAYGVGILPGVVFNFGEKKRLYTRLNIGFRWIHYKPEFGPDDLDFRVTGGAGVGYIFGL